MKNILVAAAMVIGASTGAQAASLTFAEASSGSFVESFNVSASAPDKLVLRVSGITSQFSALDFGLWDGSTLVTNVAGTAFGGNTFAVFSDKANTGISLVVGKTYTLKITGTAIATGNTALGTVVVSNGTVSPVPEPESYAMLLAGLGLMGAIARRRSSKRAA